MMVRFSNINSLMPLLTSETLWMKPISIGLKTHEEQRALIIYTLKIFLIDIKHIMKPHGDYRLEMAPMNIALMVPNLLKIIHTMAPSFHMLRLLQSITWNMKA